MAVEFFYVCLIAGLFLFGAELFAPGGILGSIGTALLLASVFFGIRAYPAYGGYIATGVVILTVCAVVAWMKYFPKSRFGQRMTVSYDLSDSSATESGLEDLVGKRGTATSALRPAGFAELNGRRVDVVTQGEMIDKGETIQVVEVEGNRVVVEKLAESLG